MTSTVAQPTFDPSFLMSKIENLDTRIDNLTQENRAMGEKITNLTQENNVLKAQVSNLQGQVTSLTERHAKEVEAHNQTKSSLQEAASKATEAASKLATLEAANAKAAEEAGKFVNKWGKPLAYMAGGALALEVGRRTYNHFKG